VPGRDVLAHLPATETGELAINTLPSFVSVPTFWLVAGGWFSVLLSKSDTKSFSSEQLANKIHTEEMTRMDLHFCNSPAMRAER